MMFQDNNRMHRTLVPRAGDARRYATLEEEKRRMMELGGVFRTECKMCFNGIMILIIEKYRFELTFEQASMEDRNLRE